MSILNRKEAIIKGENLTPMSREEAMLKKEDIPVFTRKESLIKEALGSGGSGAMETVAVYVMLESGENSDIFADATAPTFHYIGEISNIVPHPPGNIKTIYSQYASINDENRSAMFYVELPKHDGAVLLTCSGSDCDGFFPDNNTVLRVFAIDPNIGYPDTSHNLMENNDFFEEHVLELPKDNVDKVLFYDIDTPIFILANFTGEPIPSSEEDSSGGDDTGGGNSGK